jgi:hypothetical protein
MTLTQLLGYGRFRLEELLPGEAFARYDGTLARVCRRQPCRPFRPDHVLVWNDIGTSNATQVFLHKTALAYALSPEQARRIARRSVARQRRRGGPR